jgi:hypothetical protein
MERETGIEPATNSLEGCDSTTELLPLAFYFQCSAMCLLSKSTTAFRVSGSTCCMNVAGDFRLRVPKLPLETSFPRLVISLGLRPAPFLIKNRYKGVDELCGQAVADRRMRPVFPGPFPGGEVKSAKALVQARQQRRVVLVNPVRPVVRQSISSALGGPLTRFCSYRTSSCAEETYNAWRLASSIA